MLELIQYSIEFLDYYGYILVILFGMIHPFIGFPPHMLILTASIALYGFVRGYLFLLLGNVIGIVLFYVFVVYLKKMRKTNIKQDSLIDKISVWLREEPTWKHLVVLGLPLIPTHPIKYALPLSGVSFQKHMKIFIGGYLLLFVCDSLVYFGTLSFITDLIPTHIGVILITIFVIVIYFGKYIFKKQELT